MSISSKPVASTPLEQQPVGMIVKGPSETRSLSLLYDHYRKGPFCDRNVLCVETEKNETLASCFLATMDRTKMTFDSRVVVCNGPENIKEYSYVTLKPIDLSPQGQAIILYIHVAIQLDLWGRCYLRDVPSGYIHYHYCQAVDRMKTQGIYSQEPVSQKVLMSALHRFLPNLRVVKSGGPSAQSFPSKEDIEMQWAVTKKALFDKGLSPDLVSSLKRKSPPLERALPPPPPKKAQKDRSALSKQDNGVAGFAERCAKIAQSPQGPDIISYIRNAIRSNLWKRFYDNNVPSQEIHSQYWEWFTRREEPLEELASQPTLIRTLHHLLPSVDPRNSKKGPMQHFPSRQDIQEQWTAVEKAIANQKPYAGRMRCVKRKAPPPAQSVTGQAPYTSAFKSWEFYQSPRPRFAPGEAGPIQR